jgi:hypothetical protein
MSTESNETSMVEESAEEVPLTPWAQLMNIENAYREATAQANKHKQLIQAYKNAKLKELESIELKESIEPSEASKHAERMQAYNNARMNEMESLLSANDTMMKCKDIYNALLITNKGEIVRNDEEELEWQKHIDEAEVARKAELKAKLSNKIKAQEQSRKPKSSKKTVVPVKSSVEEIEAESEDTVVRESNVASEETSDEQISDIMKKINDVKSK